MKKVLQTTLCLFFLFTCFQMAIAGVPLRDYAGTWANVAPQGGIAKIVIKVKGEKAYVQAYGAEVEATAYSSGIGTSPEKNTEAIMAEFELGPDDEVHIIKVLLISMDGSGQLKMRRLSKYADDSKRHHQADSYTFRKED